MAATMLEDTFVVGVDCKVTRAERLARQVLQLVPIKQLSMLTPEDLRDLSIQEKLYADVFATEPPLGTQNYRYKVLKKILDTMLDVDRDDKDEISDNLVTSLETFMCAKPGSRDTLNVSIPQSAMVQYVPPQRLSHRATDVLWIAEATNYYSGAGTTGHRTWEAALHLSYFLCYSKDVVISGQKVLELGTGQGLVSYTCANICGARHVVPTDGTRDLVTDLIKAPATGGVKWTPRVLDWELEDGLGSLAALSQEEKTGIDLILGADITFDDRILPSLSKTLAVLTKLNPQAEIYIAATVRNPQTLEIFENTCGK